MTNKHEIELHSCCKVRWVDNKGNPIIGAKRVREEMTAALTDWLLALPDQTEEQQ